MRLPGRRGVHRLLLTTCLILGAALGAAQSASAAEQNAYAAAMNYATPTITIGKGDTLTFTNLDNLAKHDLLGHDGTFGSDLLGGGESGPVRGVEKLDEGQYQFHCSLHGWMQGVLNVGPACAFRWAAGAWAAPTARGATRPPMIRPEPRAPQTPCNPPPQPPLPNRQWGFPRRCRLVNVVAPEEGLTPG